MAIKVNNTTVINDSRALTNITSVDSATVTALGNAGVGGGATSLITNWTNVPNSQTWSLTLSASYDIIKIFLHRVGVDNQQGFVDLQARFQYSGGTETGYDYAYHRDTGSSGATVTEDRLHIGTSSGSGSSYPTRFTGEIEIKFHGDGSRLTQYRVAGVDTYNYNGNVNYGHVRQGVLHNHLSSNAHTALYFFNNYNVNYTTGQYLMMGVTL